MSNNEDMKALLSSLSAGMDAEELQLSVLQGLIAAEISLHRQKLHMSQKELAEKLNVSQALVSRWEKGECNFTLSTLVKICSALDLKMQSPIVPTPARVYSTGRSNIFALPVHPNWSSGTSSADLNFSTYSCSDEELEEM